MQNLSPFERLGTGFINTCFLSQSQWLLVPLLEGKVPVMSGMQDQLHECQTTQFTLANHQKLVLFFSNLVNEILSDSKNLPSVRSIMVPRDCLVGLWLEMSWARHWCHCVLGCSDMTEVSDNIGKSN